MSLLPYSPCMGTYKFKQENDKPLENIQYGSILCVYSACTLIMWPLDWFHFTKHLLDVYITCTPVQTHSYMHLGNNSQIPFFSKEILLPFIVTLWVSATLLTIINCCSSRKSNMFFWLCISIYQVHYVIAHLWLCDNTCFCNAMM